jgi:hypothetical protein
MTPMMIPAGLRHWALLLGVPALLASPSPSGAAEPFPIADIFFELNATDRDVGVHVFLDAHSWEEVRILGPAGQLLMQVNPRGNMRRIGLSELFFEGDEPSLAEVPFSRFLTLIPAGEYTFLGTTTEGVQLRSTDPLTTELPCPVAITFPAPDEEIDYDELVIRWRASPGIFDPDRRICAPGEVDLVAYQVTVVMENDLWPFKREFAVHLPRGARSVPVPPAFLKQGALLPDTLFTIEVLAIEDTGNKTFAAREFAVEHPDE